MQRSRLILILVLAFGLLAAACGDDAESDTAVGNDDESSDSSDNDDAAPDTPEPDDAAVSGPAPSDDDPTPDGPIPVEPDGGIGDSPFGSVPFFGANDDQCNSRTLANSTDDDALLASALDCFFTEYEAGTPVVLDVNILTIEGDPIYHRWLFDGETVTIVVDNRADSFGAGVVIAESCEGITRTDYLPAGVNCVDIDDHPGFPEAEG